ncbi:MAG: hypothetical protein JWP35_1215 [Caulobacter sp.]|nr:hypothetical protein [Caulobacter sp.]
MSLQRPAVFVGSSTEGLPIAYALQENLEYDAEPTVWPQGVFQPTHSTLAALLGECGRTDFAVFVFTPDDVRVMRGDAGSVPRDNVIFELGLFIGALGPSRCVFVIPRGEPVLQLPSDLLGLTPLTYDAARSDGRMVAALGPASNKIRHALRALGPRPDRDPAQMTVAVARPDPIDRTETYIKAWDGPELLAARAVLRAGIPLHASEDETGEATAAMQRVFAFFESLADAVLHGGQDADRLREVFEEPIHRVWQNAATYLAPRNQADEWWDPLPKIAELDRLWQAR